MQPSPQQQVSLIPHLPEIYALIAQHSFELYVLKGQEIKDTAHFNCSYPNDAKNIRQSGKCTSTDDFGDFLSNAKTAELKNIAGSMDENFLLNTNINMFNVQYITSFVSNPTDNKHSTVALPFNFNKPFLVDALVKTDNLYFNTVEENDTSKRETPPVLQNLISEFFNFCGSTFDVHSSN
ncbi:hypothetical protein CEXT_552061 [Caerostris extrusa]|uniref:Uncharacterized protein n=1 Tax=Caerostris extrusa TaxID=172846 RepID=A0AAV4X5D8_CAEEX|nr:hypothetical protein CEXT_552061 [Caerostris extrusa]